MLNLRPHPAARAADGHWSGCLATVCTYALRV